MTTHTPGTVETRDTDDDAYPVYYRLACSCGWRTQVWTGPSGPKLEHRQHVRLVQRATEARFLMVMILVAAVFGGILLGMGTAATP